MNWVTNNRDWFAPFVRQVADAMGLRDWKLNIKDDAPTDDDCGASCDVIYGRKIANLNFSAPSSPEELRHFVVHELLHCHSALVDWNANSLQPAMSQQTFDVWHGSFEDALELMVDGIAMAWMDSFPLPMHEIRMPTDDADQAPGPERPAEL